jgi:hypothetical protein
MAKKKKQIPEELQDNPVYDRYLKEHQKKLRRLERELKGDNMEEPPDYGY